MGRGQRPSAANTVNSKDRNGIFEPQVVKNRQKDISGIDEKIISMYARGLTTRQISEQIEEIYGFECSESFISDVTDKLLKNIEEWQHRSLDSVYPIVFIDACHFSVRDNELVRKLAAYVMLAIDCEGRKDMKSFANDLKTIYYAESEKAGRTALDKVNEKWCEKYPYAMKRWYDNVFPNPTALG